MGLALAVPIVLGAPDTKIEESLGLVKAGIISTALYAASGPKKKAPTPKQCLLAATGKAVAAVTTSMKNFNPSKSECNRCS